MTRLPLKGILCQVANTSLHDTLAEIGGHFRILLEMLIILGFRLVLFLAFPTGFLGLRPCKNFTSEELVIEFALCFQTQTLRTNYGF